MGRLNQCQKPPPCHEPSPCHEASPCESHDSGGGGTWQNGLVNIDALNGNSFLNHDLNGLNILSILG